MTSQLSHSLSTMPHSEDVASDDEIVWNVADVDLSLSAGSIMSDDDFVVLSRPRSHGSGTGQSSPNTVHEPTYYAEEVLVSRLSRLALNEFPNSRGTAAKTRSFGRVDGQKKASSYTTSSANKKKKNQEPAFVHANASKSYSSPAPPPNHDRVLSTVRLTHVPKYNAKKPKKSASASKFRTKATGLGSRPIVDDISEKASENGEEIGTTIIHEQAVKYITSFLTNPGAKESFCRLTLLQSLIIELGLTSCTPIVPSSMKEAKALLKSRAFVNIREYLAVREQGQAALQRVMHPNRMALIKDIRTKGNPASLKWVKQNGLQVLLVTCFH